MIINNHEVFQYHVEVKPFNVAGSQYFDIHFYSVYLDSKTPDEKFTKMRLTLSEVEFQNFKNIISNI